MNARRRGIRRWAGWTRPRSVLARWLRDEAVTLLQVVPRLFREMWQAVELAGDPATWWAALRHVLFVGEALPPDLVAQVQHRLGPRVEILNVYGPTEVVAATF